MEPAKEKTREEKLEQNRAGQKGKLTGDYRRKKSIQLFTSSDPRNAMEALFIKHYGTGTPVPPDTMRRKQAVITAAILWIHYGQPLTRAAQLTGVADNYLDKVLKEDKWEEFAQELAQFAKPSNLTLVPSHDMKVLEAEMGRRMKEVSKFHRKEEELLAAMAAAEPGSKEETAILMNIKKVRGLVDNTLQLDAYFLELHSARKALAVGQVRNMLGHEPESLQRQSKGAIIEL